MSLIDQSRIDLQEIMENSDEFAVPVTFAKRLGGSPVTVNCLTNKIMVEEMTTGVPVITERTTVAVYETTLTDVGYTVRNAAGNVAMVGDLVTCSLFGGEKQYTVKFQIPDQNFGCLVFALEDYVA